MNQIQKLFRFALLGATLLSAADGATAAPLDQLQWLEAPHEPKPVEWARQETAKTTQALSALPGYQGVMTELRRALRASPPLAGISLLGPYALRLQKDATHPHGQLQVAERKDDGTLAAWRSVLDVDALRRKEGKAYDLQLQGLGSFAKNCLAPAYRYCLLQLAPNGGDEIELREFDLVAGKFVDGGLRTPASRIQVAWLDTDRVLIAHTIGKSPLTKAGWGAAVRLWKRDTPVEQAPIVYQAKPDDAILTLDRVGGGDTGRGVIQRVPDYSTFEMSLIDASGKLTPVALPAKLKPFGLLAATQRHLVVQLAEASTVDGKRFAPETLLSYDIAPATPGASRVSVVYQPRTGEYIEPAYGGVAATRERLAFVVKRGLDNSVQVANAGNDGWQVQEALATGPGTAIVLESGDVAGQDLVVRTQGFLAPPATQLMRPGRAPVKLEQEAPAFDASRMVVETRQAKSKDGTMIDYYLVRPRDIPAGRSTPTLMTGYGAFGISFAPGYLDGTVGGKGTKLWFERGGALVVPAIRGGGERGAAWHRAAMRERRQTSYDDFIAVAEDLVKRGFVKPRQLGVFGLSNGGLLAATIGAQRPDLFGSVVSDVPLIDMLRYPTMGMGSAWIDEYGDPADPALAKVLASYSPLHIVKEGVDYPPYLVTVATSDNRVGPGHARKMVARLHELKSPAYLYEDADGGHGVSDPLTRPDLMALRMTFLINALMPQK